MELALSVTAIGFLIFSVGSAMATARTFTSFLDQERALLDQVGFMSTGLFLMALSNAIGQAHYLVAALCVSAAAFNAYTCYVTEYHPTSGVLKSHEIKHIVSKDTTFEISNFPRRIEAEESNGVFTIYDHGSAAEEETAYVCHSPNADKHGIFNASGVGRWQYRSKNWLRYRSFIYSFFIKLRERAKG